MTKAFSPVITLLAVAAGFVGGVASQFLLPTPLVHAQVESPPRMVAQRFVLVDPKGVTRGEFKIEGDQPQIILYNRDGSVAWKATPESGRPHVSPMTANHIAR